MTSRSDRDLEARMAAYATAFDLGDAPRRVRDRAALVLLDTVGVCLRGAETPYVSAAARDDAGLCTGAPLDGPGGTVFATMERRPPAEAALLNAAGGTTLELDEGNQRSGHPAIHTVPPALAVAEHRGASGRELLAALVVGYEVGARVGDLVRPLRDGLHPHGAWAPVSGAVATGRLLGLDTDDLAAAIRIAVAPSILSHWAAALEGATVRDFYTGLSAAHGVRAAALADAEVTGVAGAIADCLLPHAAAEAVPEALLDEAAESMGNRYYLDSSYVKVHAACRYTHAPIEAMAAIRARETFDPAAVERVTVRTFELGTMLDETAPHNALAAKFSTPYALAARAILGRTDAEAFTPDLVADDRLQSFASRVEVVVDPAFEARAAEGQWGATVEVELVDGTVYDETVRDARGGGENPLTREDVLEKFDGLVGHVAGPDAAGALRDRLLDVAEVEDAASLLDPVRP